jgi:hypothetical protein
MKEFEGRGSIKERRERVRTGISNVKYYSR